MKRGNGSVAPRLLPTLNVTCQCQPADARKEGMNYVTIMAYHTANRWWHVAVRCDFCDAEVVSETRSLEGSLREAILLWNEWRRKHEAQK